MWTLYAHINKINGKTYIGITSKTPQSRWGSKGSHYKRCIKFYTAIEKYGWDNFEHVILKENLTEKQAKSDEQKLIRKNKNLGISYNITDGGDGNKGWMVSDETKKKIAKSHAGKKLSEEHKKHIGESGKGRIVSKETRNKISKSKMGHEVKETTRKIIGEKSRRYFLTHESHFKGKSHTEEAIQSNILNQKTRTIVYQYTLDGNLIKTYDSKGILKREGQFALSTVNSRCKFNSNKALNECKEYRGFIFREQKLCV